MLAGEPVDLGHFVCVRFSAESLVVIRIDVVLVQARRAMGPRNTDTQGVHKRRASIGGSAALQQAESPEISVLRLADAETQSLSVCHLWCVHGSHLSLQDAGGSIGCAKGIQRSFEVQPT